MRAKSTGRPCALSSSAKPGAEQARGSVEHAEYVAFAQDQVRLAVDLDLGAVVLAEQHLVAGLEHRLTAGAVFAHEPGPHGHHHALHGLLLGGVGNDDAALGLALGLHTLDENAITERSNFCHDVLL